MKKMSTDVCIYAKGYFSPTLKQKKLIRKIGTDDFCSSVPVPEDFQLPDGWKIDRSTGIALKMRSVEPHTDDWVGAGSPKHWKSLFWVVECKRPWLHLMVEGEHVRMKEGDYVLFDDRKLHCVVSQYQWTGVAFQVR